MPKASKKTATVPVERTVAGEVTDGSFLEFVSGLLDHHQKRVRKPDAPKAKGTITGKEYDSIVKLSNSFLEYLNRKHGQGAVGRLTLAELQMTDVEDYNLSLVQDDYSQSQVRKRMLVVKNIIDRAGRPEHGHQRLSWNWDSRSVYHGRPDKEITLPTAKQLQLILKRCDEQRAAVLWMAVGLGFGQSDLAKARVRHLDKDSYDMRRGKTGIERFGTMPPRVWDAIEKHLKKNLRNADDLLFLTEDGKPLVHGKTDSIAQWWEYTRETLVDSDGNPAGEELNGFYSLRHLGATEFGSRPTTSLNDLRGWLGHSKSSTVCDRYMKLPAPEYKEVIKWLRKALLSTGPL